MKISIVSSKNPKNFAISKLACLTDFALEKCHPIMFFFLHFQGSFKSLRSK